ncbi:MAG: LuxR C-terminal-related transcriptional regulator [Terriglobales bacterium]
MSCESFPPAATPVFLLAENRLLREALVRLLCKKPDVVVVGASAFGPTLLEEIASVQPDVVLLDSVDLVFSGPRVIPGLRERMPEAKIVMISMERDEEVFLRALAEGAVGYVLKDASALDIVNAIRAVSSGEAVFPPCFSRALVRCAAQQRAGTTEISASPLGLSRREQQLVELVRMGLTNKEIATRLNLAEQTIKNHVHRILRKVGARDRLTLVERCHVRARPISQNLTDRAS